jgi:hypothetical protein
MTPQSDPQAIIKLRDLKFSCDPEEFCDLEDYTKKQDNNDKFQGQVSALDAFVAALPIDKPEKNCLVIEGGQKSVLCIHHTQSQSAFEEALLKAHEIDELSGALESYPPLGIGKSIKGKVFVNKELMNTGDIDIKGGELDFVGASPVLKLKYKDVAP